MLDGSTVDVAFPRTRCLFSCYHIPGLDSVPPKRSDNHNNSPFYRLLFSLCSFFLSLLTWSHSVSGLLFIFRSHIFLSDFRKKTNARTNRQIHVNMRTCEYVNHKTPNGINTYENKKNHVHFYELHIYAENSTFSTFFSSSFLMRVHGESKHSR